MAVFESLMVKLKMSLNFLFMKILPLDLVIIIENIRKKIFTKNDSTSTFFINLYSSL